MVDLVERFLASGRVLAAVGYGAELLIETGAMDGRVLTSWPSLRTDLENAGATWVDRPWVEDGNLVTARESRDLGAVCGALLSHL